MMQNAKRQQQPADESQGAPISLNGHHGHNGTAHRLPQGSRSKQRVTITLPAALLERLRNAVYWTGHGTLACLIAEALDDAVGQMEETHGGPFPIRLEPLKRGRPRLRPRRLTDNPTP